jgi:Domain of unknown function (DUF4157)
VREHVSKSPSADAVRASSVLAPRRSDDGQKLEPTLRREMESRFAFDFSRVRVHGGPEAERAARRVEAVAYTVGADIVFDAGRYAPASPDGRRLIAHELAHVVQQGATPVPNVLAPPLPISTEAGPEREAALAADGAGASVPRLTPVAPGTIQRQTQRQIARDDHLRRLAEDPADALAAWHRLSEGERTVVVMYMAARYSPEFARHFMETTRLRHRPEAVVNVTNAPDVTPESLTRRGYRFQRHLAPELQVWVHPTGREVWLIRSQPSRATGAAPPTQQPAAPEPPPAEPPQRIGRARKAGGRLRPDRAESRQSDDPRH